MATQNASCCARTVLVPCLCVLSRLLLLLCWPASLARCLRQLNVAAFGGCAACAACGGGAACGGALNLECGFAAFGGFAACLCEAAAFGGITELQQQLHVARLRLAVVSEAMHAQAHACMTNLEFGLQDPKFRKIEPCMHGRDRKFELDRAKLFMTSCYLSLEIQSTKSP